MSRIHFLPKSVTISNGKYYVKIYSRKDGKFHFVGIYDTVKEAVSARDKWLVENYLKVEGYLPRGIRKSKTLGKYEAQLCLKGTNRTSQVTRILGTFNSIQEAVDYRTKYILGLL